MNHSFYRITRPLILAGRGMRAGGVRLLATREERPAALHLSIYLSIYIHIHIHAHMYTHTHIYIYIYIYTHTHTHTRTHTQTHMYLCMYIYITLPCPVPAGRGMRAGGVRLLAARKERPAALHPALPHLWPLSGALGTVRLRLPPLRSSVASIARARHPPGCCGRLVPRAKWRSSV